MRALAESPHLRGLETLDLTLNHDITIDGIRALLRGLPNLRWFSSPSHQLPKVDWDELGDSLRIPFKHKGGGIPRTWHRFPFTWWL